MAASATKPRTNRRRSVADPDPTTADISGGSSASYLVHLDPRELLNHPANPRRDLGDLTELRTTLTVQGVLQALTVVPTGDGGYRILAGHRRAAAVAEALNAGDWPADRPPPVPCLVRPDLAKLDADQLVGMITENDQRVGLTHSERAAGYAQLALFGLDADEIARRTGRPIPHVRSTLRLHELGNDAMAAADQGTVTLDDIAALEDFDERTVQRIVKDVATPWGIRHRIVGEQRKRRQQTESDRLTTELAEAGVLVVRKPKGWPYTCPEAAVRDLRTADGESIDPVQVQAQEGFAAFIDRTFDGATAVHMCLDPEAHGFQRPRFSSYKTAQQLAEEETARHAEQEQQAALTDAQDVRERFLTERYGTAKAAKTLLLDALRATVDEPGFRDDGDAELIQGLAGGDITTTAGAGLDRLHRLLVAMWIAAEEANLAEVTAGRRWRGNASRAVAWLDRLTAAGYELSPAEAGLRDQLTAPSAASGTDRDEVEDIDDADREEDGDTDAANTAGADPVEEAAATA